MKSKRKLQVIMFIFLVALAAYAYHSGPDKGYTGAPGDIQEGLACAACHDTYHTPNVGPGRIQIINNPAVYQPGQSYTITVTVQDPSRRRWGFEMTAIDKDGMRAGTFAPLGPDTQIATTGSDVLNRQYIEHTAAGTFPGTTGGHSWQVRWTAPDKDIGTVRFYAAGNAANNDGTNQGDYIYTTSVISESPSTVVTVSLTSSLDNQTLLAGLKYTISWAITNPSNVDNIEVRYSTDDGLTFPITNQIFFTRDPSVTSFDWLVPNTPTNQGRIRVQVATKSGSAVEASSGRFTISGNSLTIPTISSAEVRGSKLFVYGDNFQMGAVVLLNDIEQRTINLDDFAHQLRCKKAGNRIAPGEKVTLKVRNPDGAVSAPFFYTRPPE
jgi:hypothetical protein